MEKYFVYDVFTPTTPARLTFIERDSINSKLVDALRTPGKQLVVYGYSGSGKTTLLINKLHQLYENHITSRCMDGMKFEQLLLDAFDQLSPYYTAEKDFHSKTSFNLNISQDYFSIKSQIGASSSKDISVKEVRVVPPQLTAQALARFIGETNCCWVLEDFHKLPVTERKKLSQVMKIFMDMADNYRSLKIVAIGAANTARQVVEYDSEMRNRVAEIHVPLMNLDEIRNIIILGAKLLNLKFSEALIDGISNYTNGLASVCHNICLKTCTSMGINETSDCEIEIKEEVLESALSLYLEDASDTLQKVFEKAFKQKRIRKYDNTRLILMALSNFPQEGATRAAIYQEILKLEPKYPSANLTLFLNKLCEAETDRIVKYDQNSGKYSFTDPLYRSFAIILFREAPPKLSGEKKSQGLNDVLEIWRKELTRELKNEILIFKINNLTNRSS